MRKIVVGEFITLDGVMQSPGAPEEDPSNGFELGGWIVNLFDEEVGKAMAETFSQPYDLLLGRKTYDIFAAHWGRIAADSEVAAKVEPGDVEMAKAFDRATKYVATHSPQTLSWKKSESLGSDIIRQLKELKKSDGPMLLVQGSGKLVQSLLKNDLVDELRLLIFPVVLGKGQRLFAEGTIPAAFKVIQSKTTQGGVILINYERSGKIDLGSYALT